MKVGWARFHRAFTDSDLWLGETFTKGQAFVDLFVNANHKDGTVWVRGVPLEIKRGQIAWSEITMSKRWGWSRNKVRRFLKWLKNDKKIAQQTIQHTTTVLTLVNYEIYQSDDTANDTQRGQQKDNRRYTNKNDKKEKKEYSGELASWLEEYNSKYGSKYKPTEELLSLFSHWRSTYSQEEILSIIPKIGKHDWLSDKHTPILLFRRKDRSQTPVDRIGELLSLKGRTFL